MVQIPVGIYLHYVFLSEEGMGYHGNSHFINSAHSCRNTAAALKIMF